MDSKGNNQSSCGGQEARYANYFEIGHNAFEFILDFGQSYFEESEPKTKIHSRIVISAFYAGMLLEVLQKAVKQYGQRFGRFLTEAVEIEAEPAKVRESNGGQILKIIPKKS